MKNDIPNDTDDVVDGEIIPAKRGGISWAWLFPILALAATGWLFWNNWDTKGPEIVIHFTSAPGIDPGKTSLIYRGVTAGTVSKVHLDRKLGTVVVTVSVKKFAAELATEGTDFWIEQPVITLHEISGLESIIQGNSIHARTHGSEKLATVFHALNEAPLSALNSEVLRVTLNSDSNSFVGRGTPVFHRGINVGKVREKNFNEEGKPEIEVTIFEKYTDQVRTNSRFWVTSATAVTASPGAVRLDIPSLQGLLDGSIAFDHFSPDGDEVTNGTEFELSADEVAARAEGPRLNISFEDGKGLRAGATRVTYLGQSIGLVEEITTDPKNKRVEVVARLNKEFTSSATSDSVFTVIHPSIDLKGIHGLDTLVTGPTIRFEPGQSDVQETHFVGNVTPQIDLDFFKEDPDGIRVTLRAEKLPQLEAGAPVYHRGMIAGQVVEQRMATDGTPEVIISINREFRDFLRINSRFWRVPPAKLAVGPGLIDVEVQGLTSLLQGGIAFDTFGSSGPAAAETAEYELHVNEQMASAISPPIRITFEDGQGLVAGITRLQYLGVSVGIVESVNASEGKVVATARFKPGYDFLRSRGSEFAIIRPEIDLKGVHGLETVIGGVHIACAPGGSSEYAASFHSVPAEEPVLLNEPGFEIVIVSASTKVDAGAPISYNSTPVGEVIAKTLSQDGKQIVLTARIHDEHSNLVRSNSIFWDVSTVEAKIGFLKVEIDTPAVLHPNGRIEFHTPDARGAAVKRRTVFPLLSESPKPTEPPKPTKTKMRGFRNR